MSLTQTYQFDSQVLIDANKHVVNSPKLLQTALKRRELRLRQLTLKIVAVSPGAVHYPIRWKSDRQRRKVMAMLSEQGNLPYQRTGSLLEGYNAKFEFTDEGGAFVVENTSPVAQYIIGDDQQPFHLDTGWKYLPNVVDEQVVPLVLRDYEETWYSVADPFVRE